MNKRALRLILLSGLLIPVIFWGSTIIAGKLNGNYSHIRNTISELGAIGANAEKFMTISTWITVIISIAFFSGLLFVCRQLNINKLPLIGILGFAITFGWAAIFHSGNSMHSKAAPTAILLLLGPLLAAILWKGKYFKKLRLFSLLSLVIMLLILIRVIPSPTIQNNYTGLIQRLVHFGWSIWFISLSLTFSNQENLNKH